MHRAREPGFENSNARHARATRSRSRARHIHCSLRPASLQERAPMHRMHEFILILLLLPVLATGCFTVRHEYEGNLILTSDASIPGFRAETIRHFVARDLQFFWLHGGFPVGEPLNGAALAAQEADGHDGVTNLRIREGQDFTDTVITHVACVLSLLCGTWSVWTEGDVVDLAEAR